MTLIVTQRPLSEVAKTVSAKTPIGSKLSSAQWEGKVAAELRDESFFSAKIQSVRALQAAQSGLVSVLDQTRNANGTLAMDRSKWIAEIQKTANRLGLRTREQEKRGSIEDFGSERRLKLILEQQIGAAQARAYYESGQDPDLLDAWPAQELVRLRTARAPRDWTTRWAEAAAKVNWEGVARNGRMAALKTSPIWVKLSRFGRPWPPFDFNSGMGLEEIDREEAEEMRLLAPGESLEPTLERDTPAASVKGLAPDMRAALLDAFGDDQIEIVGDEARWRGLPEQGERALQSYTGPGYERMNAELRDGTPSPAMERKADRLNDALDELPDFGGDVYRGTAADYDLSKYFDNIGQVIEEPAFTSTSAEPDGAFGGAVRFFISSTHGKYVDHLSSTPGEDEVLFKHGTRFRVLDARQNEDLIEIYLEEVP